MWWEKREKVFTNAHENTIKEALINPDDIDVTLDDVGGLADIKENIRLSVLLPIRHYAQFFNPSAKHLRPKCGILLHGPPGTGKTMLAKAIAKDSNANFLCLTASNLESKWFGETNRLLAAAFSFAKKRQPCILFFDEIDGLGRIRSEFDSSGTYSLKTELLQHMDGVTSQVKDCVFVIGCTNNLNNLDPALKRRFTKQFYVNVPTQEERQSILKALCKNETKIDNGDIAKVASWTPGYTGSDLNALYHEVSNNRMMDVLKQIETNVEDLPALTSNLKPITLSDWKNVLGVSEEEDESPPP